MPFLGRNYPELIGNLKRGTFTIEKDIFLSCNCAQFIQDILKYDADARINWEDLHNHPYIQSEEYHGQSNEMNMTSTFSEKFSIHKNGRMQFNSRDSSKFEAYIKDKLTK